MDNETKSLITLLSLILFAFGSFVVILILIVLSEDEKQILEKIERDKKNGKT